MIEVLRRHRISLVVFAILLLLLLLLWLLVFRQDNGKIPLRGVFVVQHFSILLKGVA